MSNEGISNERSNPGAFAILIRHHYRTLSALLAFEEHRVDEIDHWHESKQIFLPALLRLWIQAGRPEIKWRQLAGLPAADSGQCILQSYLERVKMMSNNESSA